MMNILEALDFIKVNDNLMARPKPLDYGKGRKGAPVYWDGVDKCYRNSITDCKMTTISFHTILREWEVAKEFIEYETVS